MPEEKPKTPSLFLDFSHFLFWLTFRLAKVLFSLSIRGLDFPAGGCLGPGFLITEEWDH